MTERDIPGLADWTKMMKPGDKPNYIWASETRRVCDICGWLEGTGHSPRCYWHESKKR